MRSFQPASVPLPYQRLAISLRSYGPLALVAKHTARPVPKQHTNLYALNPLPLTIESTMENKRNIKDNKTYNWFSVQQVCTNLGVSTSTFYKWRATQKGPRAKRLPNGELRIREDWFNDFMNDLPEAVA
jgi:predicted DNA-binding transcriptional regulator AlpA